MGLKIGILTLQLHDNYGGILQAYALKTALEQMGHQVSIINRKKNLTGIVFKIKQLINSILGRGKNNKLELSEEEKEIISRNTKYFIDTYIKDITEPIYSTRDLKKTTKEFEAFIVGSDQVWRPRYSPCIENYFLNFVNNPTTIGLSYAASFGVSNWEFTKSQTKRCRENIHKFKAIAVRENSGVDLCAKYFGVNGTHVLDPTMLIDTNEYVELINQENEQSVNGDLLYYVLDTNNAKEELVRKIAKVNRYKTFSVTRKGGFIERPIQNIEDFVYPKVTYWLNGFKEAKFIVTDSFHGTVFSILFNKPFLVIPNSKRGRARFDSLLEMFQLESRLVDDLIGFSCEKLADLPPIDWGNVNAILKEKRKISSNFLRSNLTL